MAGRPKGSADFAPEVRGGLKRAMKIMEERGKPISTIWLDLFENDPLNAMRLAISMMPKEMDITTTNLSPEQWLEAMSDRKPESNGPEDTVSGQLH